MLVCVYYHVRFAVRKERSIGLYTLLPMFPFIIQDAKLSNAQAIMDGWIFLLRKKLVRHGTSG